jgi:hypothetical protein
MWSSLFTRLLELFKKWYRGYFSGYVIMARIFAMRRYGVLNPHSEELRAILREEEALKA